MSNEKHPVELIHDLADETGGAVTEVQQLSDGSGFAMLSMPLREDHWLYNVEGGGYSGGAPMPMAAPAGDPLRTILQDHVQTAARYGVRSATACGREDDFDPDALVRNVEIGLFGYYGKNSPYSHDLEHESPVGGKLLNVVEDALDARGRSLFEIRDLVNRRLAADLEQTNNLNPEHLVHPAFHVELMTLGALMLRHNKSAKALQAAMARAAVEEWGVDPETAARVIFSGVSLLVNFDKNTLKDWTAFDEERRRKWREANPEAAARMDETVATGANGLSDAPDAVN